MVQSLPMLDIKLNRIDCHYLPSKWHDIQYRDSFTRLYLILGGEGEIYHSKQRFYLSPGHIYLIPEYTLHDYKHNGNMQLYYIHCQIRTPGGISFFDFYDCDFVINSRETGLGYHQFEALRELYGKSDPSSQLSVSSKLLRLISPFITQTKSQPVKGRERDMARLMGVLNYIEEHLCDDPGVKELSEMMNMERSAFSRLFSQVLGTPPGKFIQKKRIEAARHMLDNSPLSCEQVGEKMGFYDGSHFSRIFQRETGVRPGDYREREGRNSN
jgi:AraC family transcriptional regulator of arabinose operon